jgi:hypothetical protein
MEKYKSVYPTLRQAKTKWSKPSIVAKQGEGPSHDWYEMMKKDARAKLAASIHQAHTGSIHKQERIVHEGKVPVYGFLTQLQNIRMKETGVKKRKNRMTKDPRPTDFSRPDLKEEDRIGKQTPSAESIAKKHNKDIAEIQAQIDKGIKVEREHTNSDAEAHEIARDHLDEFPDYYDRLDKMEKKAKKDMKEGYDPEKEQIKNRIEAHKSVAEKMAKEHGEQSMEAAFHRALVRRYQKELGEDSTPVNEATMVGSGPDAQRHADKYITPYVGQKETHTLKKDNQHIPAKTKVTVHGHKVVDGKYHAVVSGGGSSKKINVPFTHVNKPVVAKNKGLDYESKFVKTLNKHGLMSGKGAGSTSGNDFHLIDKKTGKVHHGKVAEHAYQGESKKDLSAAYGQASLSHHPKKGWHFSDKAKERFPHYTAAIEKATVTVGKTKKPLLKHVNEQFGAPHPVKKSSHNVYSDPTDLHPAHAYMKDHHVDVLHVGSHGTYRAGLSHHKDRTPLGLPKTEGEGRYRVRQKHRNSLTVQFNIKKLEKSSVHLDNPEHLNAIKKKLGHSTLKEEVANSVGGGMSPVIGGESNIHGFDPIMGKSSRRKTFAGKQVFVVDPTTYHKAYLGKRKYEHYEKYLEGSPYFEEIREYGRKNWDEPIILQNEQTGAMVYLKYGSK